MGEKEEGGNSETVWGDAGGQIRAMAADFAKYFVLLPLLSKALHTSTHLIPTLRKGCYF